MVSALGYNGNPRLRRAYTQVAMSQHEVDEYKKCARDPIYFIKNYMKIVVLGKGVQPFDLYDFQERMIKTFRENRFVICKIPRQSGKSITTIAYLLHTILFEESVNIALTAHKGSAANGLLARLKLAYENLPPWLQSGILEWNKGNIELENGSKIAAFATAADGLRSGSYDIVCMDEVAFIPNNIAEAFFTSTYPVISSGKHTKIIAISTPKGFNHFATMWMKAEKGLSDYVPIEVHWSAIPGRDEAWKEQTIRNTSEEQFQQEFQCEFLGSSDTLISSSKIKQLLAQVKNPIIIEENLDIYYEPIPDHTYVITVDVAEGQGKDFSTFSVFDVTSVPYIQVAKYKNNLIAPMLFPTIIFTAGKKYNDAFVLVEINSIGLQVADILHFELDYENLLKFQMKGKQGQQPSGGFGMKNKIAYGVKTTTQTKNIGCTNLKALIENDKLFIYDESTINEITNFTAQKKSFQADEGSNDDLVMTLVHFAWLTSQRVFKDAIGSNIRQILQEEQLHIMDADILPFGVMNNGLNDPFADDDFKEKDLWVAARESSYPFDNIEWDILTNKHRL